MTRIDILDGLEAAIAATEKRRNRAALVVAEIAAGNRYPGYLNQPAVETYRLESAELDQLHRELMAVISEGRAA